MWIKTSKGMLINMDNVIALGYNDVKNEIWCASVNGSECGPVCRGDATGVITQAIQRDQKYLEVNDCE